jgi:hypothetical protein
MSTDQLLANLLKSSAVDDVEVIRKDASLNALQDGMDKEAWIPAALAQVTSLRRPTSSLGR